MYVAILKVTFTRSIDNQDDAELQANNCVVALVESEIVANVIQDAVVKSVEKEGPAPAATSE